MTSDGGAGRRGVAEAAIIAAASELLEEGRSYAGVSVEQIARRAGLGRTAFYFYFRDKRELLMRLAEDVTRDLFEVADGWWHGDADLADSLERIAVVYREHRQVLRVLTETAGYDDEVRVIWVGLVNRFVEATRERIETDQRAGAAADVDAGETAKGLVWMCERSLYHFSRETPDADPGPMTAALIGIFTRSIYGRVPA